MDWQVKAEEEALNDALLHHDLVKVRQHVVDARQVRHHHLEAQRFRYVDDWYMNLVGAPKVRSFVLFVALSQQTQDGLLASLVRLRLHLLLTSAGCSA